mgnify:CR=1 FL=1
MLEVYEIRIDEFERMLRNHTLVCPDWADERIDKLEQLITDNGVAYAIIGKDMFFNNAYSMAPSVIAVNDVDGIASSASALEPEMYVGDKFFTKVFCYELWRVRDLTDDERYFEYGEDDEAADYMQYEHCLNTFRNSDHLLEAGYSKVVEDALDYITEYESRYHIGRDVHAIESYERACNVLETSEDESELVSALDYYNAFKRAYDVACDFTSFYPVMTFSRKSDYALDLEELRLAGSVENV